MERRMIELLRNKRFSLLLAALFIGYLAYTRMPDIFEQRFVPPHDNGDGTIDYTLVTRNPKLEEKHLWIIRLPKEVWAELSEDGRIGDVSINGGPAIGFNSIANYQLEISFWPKDLTPYLKSSGNFPPRSNLQVIVYEGKKPFSQWLPRLPEALVACDELPSPDRRVRRFTQKAHPTPESLEANCFAKDVIGKRQFGHLLLDSAGSEFGTITCDSELQADGRCYGFIWLPQDRKAQLNFKSSDFPPGRMQDMVSLIHAYLTKATILTETVRQDQEFSVELGGK
jgi:hypothetical protein